MVGSHLFEMLAARGERVVATYHTATIDVSEIASVGTLEQLDVCDAAAVLSALERHKPAAIYHLAAQSYPTVSWQKPIETMRINGEGTINVFEAVLQLKARDPAYDPVVVVACSSAEYGASLRPENLPIREEAQLLPLHPYGVSKVTQDLLAYQYWVGRNVRCIRARIFNTTGARKQGDVVSDWAARVARIAADGAGELTVGNTEGRRAILDVADLVRALTLLAEKGAPGEAYNISGKEAYRMGDLVDIFSTLVGRPIQTRVDPALLRPTDEPVIIGDVSKLQAATGWRQEVTLHDTIAAVFAYEQTRLRKSRQ